jgi:hypothetical protein
LTEASDRDQDIGDVLREATWDHEVEMSTIKANKMCVMVSSPCGRVPD